MRRAARGGAQTPGDQTSRGRDHGVEVGVLGAAEFLAAVDDPDVVLLGQRQRVFDRRVAGADDQDRLVAELLGIVQLVLDALQVFARRTELARIAFEADRQHDVRGLHDLAVGELQVEGMLIAADFPDFRAVADVDAALLQSCRPPRQHLLAAARAEFDVAAQIQEAWLRHDVLAFLIALDRLGVDVEAFQQHVAGRAALGATIAVRRASGSAQPGGTRADDSDLVHAGTAAPPPALIR